jgi:hypothetical protein
MAATKKLRVTRHVDGSRTIANTFIPKRWADLPETHISTVEPDKHCVSFANIYATYNASNMDVFLALLELAEKGNKFTISGFARNKAVRGRGKTLYVSKNILPMLGNVLAEQGERRAARGIKGIRAITSVAQGKLANGESLVALAATADRVLQLLPLMNAAFGDLAKQVKFFVNNAK